MQKTLKLNFKLEEPTHNGTIYLEHEFREAMTTALNRPFLGFFNFSGDTQKPAILDMLGKVITYSINKDKEIFITLDIVAPNFNEEILNHCDITMASMAQLDGESIVTELAILHFFMGHR